MSSKLEQLLGHNKTSTQQFSLANGVLSSPCLAGSSWLGHPKFYMDTIGKLTKKPSRAVLLEYDWAQFSGLENQAQDSVNVRGWSNL